MVLPARLTTTTVAVAVAVGAVPLPFLQPAREQRSQAAGGGEKRDFLLL